LQAESAAAISTGQERIDEGGKGQVSFESKSFNKL
jgi:hypothetical protein